ncbi:DUF4232 domain-containing protein [Actinokineospora guangxiensis]|uniref:DUF4232 domain-containing protein n=1 Tax=Actinokineospora guangxiensis TaxID=1490288 RepID=A0ABW0EWR6_9PSEU
MRVRLIGIIGLLSLAAACGGSPPVQEAGSTPSANTTANPTANPTATSAEPPATSAQNSSPTAETSPAPTATGDPTEAAAPTDCKAAELSLAVKDESGAAGTVYRNLVFTNKGKRTCTMQGFPGVSYVAGDDGHQVGPAAYRDGTKGAAVTLKPGGAAVAPVGFVNVRNYDSAVCKPTEVRGLRVYPPHDTASMFVAVTGLGCAGNPPGNQLVVKTVIKG